MRGALTLTPSYYEALRRLTLELAGVRVGSDHAFLVETRLASLAREEGYESLERMIQELFKSGQSRLAVRVVSALVERDTHFFRDPESLDRLFDIALTQLMAVRGGGALKVLCYGCGSGQDVYSIAMRASELAKDDGHPLHGAEISVTGVDYPSQALDRARAGRYTHFDVQRGLAARTLVTHFDPAAQTDAGGAQDWFVKSAIRDATAFHEMHLMSDTDAIGQFHAVTFRGALDAYSATAKVRVLRSLTKLIRPHGYLVLGSDDTLGDMLFGLEAVADAPGLYRKRLVAPKPEQPDPDAKTPNGRTAFDGPTLKRRSAS